nr:uncharacterized protein LOC109763549 [Aegilops tauschii subsp. strangulata]
MARQAWQEGANRRGLGVAGGAVGGGNGGWHGGAVESRRRGAAEPGRGGSATARGKARLQATRVAAAPCGAAGVAMQGARVRVWAQGDEREASGASRWSTTTAGVTRCRRQQAERGGSEGGCRGGGRAREELPGAAGSMDERDSGLDERRAAAARTTTGEHR